MHEWRVKDPAFADWTNLSAIYLAGTRLLEGFFSFFQCRGKVNQIVVREILHFTDQGGQGAFEFCQRRILLGTGGARDDGAQISYTLFQRGGHNHPSISKISPIPLYRIIPMA